VFNLHFMKVSTEIGKLHALTDSADISTITIENMPGGTIWGQAQLRIFDRKFLPALKQHWLRHSFSSDMYFTVFFMYVSVFILSVNWLN
jgi:hypothetical protein